MRSLLFVPAHKDYLIEKALKSQADAIIFDLEDSCPDGNKEAGIRNINTVNTDKIKIVRISDNKQIGMLNTGFILYPKAEKPLPLDNYIFILLIETAKGIIDLPELITDLRICGVAFGNEDYKADTGCSNYDFARQMILNYSKAYRKFAIDTVFIDVKDEQGFINDCRTSYNSGFDGRLCLTPKQAEIANWSYMPTKNEYKKAQLIIKLYSQAEKEGNGVAIIEGVYIAPPMVKRSEKIIKRYAHYSQKYKDNI